MLNTVIAQNFQFIWKLNSKSPKRGFKSYNETKPSLYVRAISHELPCLKVFFLFFFDDKRTYLDKYICFERQPQGFIK